MRLAGYSAVSPPRRSLLSALTAALTLVAVLVCMLLAHPGDDGRSLADSVSMALAPAAHAQSMDAAQLAPATIAAAVARPAMTVVAAVNRQVICFEGNSLGGGPLSGAICSVLLVVSSILLIAGAPSALGILFFGGSVLVGAFRSIPLHLHRPSLIRLSISRT